ncbi:MAG: enoyl-CoA hydratase, partial [Actinomycetia bacterium]|nr:enoyl-CoA hydratase [Actinomycetes bacterium]
VGWSWLTEALELHAPGYTAPSGTVTRVITEGFGAKSDELPATGFELRASWSPPEDTDLGVNVAAWCDLLAAAAGLPPQPPGTRALHSGRKEPAGLGPGTARPGQRRQQ